MNFASRESFKKALYRLTNFQATSGSIASLDQKGTTVKCVIVDLSGLTYVDASGVKTLHNSVQEMQTAGLDVLLVTAASPIFEQLKNYEMHGNSSVKLQLYPTIHDAVQFASQKSLPTVISYETLANHI